MKNLLIAIFMTAFIPCAFAADLAKNSVLAKKLNSNELAMKLLRQDEFSVENIMEARAGLGKYFNDEELNENEIENLHGIVKNHCKNELLKTIINSFRNENLNMVIELYESIFEENIYDFFMRNPKFYMIFYQRLMDFPVNNDLLRMSNNGIIEAFWFNYAGVPIASDYGNNTKMRIAADSIVSLIRPDIVDKNNYYILKRLLETKLTNPQHNETIHRINCITTLIRAEIALFIDLNPIEAIDLLEGIETDVEFIDILRKRRLGELFIGHYHRYLYSKKSELLEFSNREKGIYFLNEVRDKSDCDIEKNQILICLAQYYFGLSIWPIDAEKDKAFELLNEESLNKDSMDFHFKIAKYRMPIEYYLYISKSEENLECLRELIEEIPASLKEHPTMSHLLGEIALRRDIGERDVESAIKYYEYANNYEILYEIYAGKYGEEYQNLEKAQENLEKGVVQGRPVCILHKAIQYFNEGHHNEAIELLDGDKFESYIFYYWKGRFLLHKNNQESSHEEAMRYFYKVIRNVENYRDTKERIITIVGREYGDSEFVLNHLNLIKEHIEKEHSLKRIIEALENAREEEKECVDPSEELFKLYKLDHYDSSEKIGNSDSFDSWDGIEEINNLENSEEAPIILLNKDIEDFMDDVGSLRNVKGRNVEGIMNDCCKLLGAEFSNSRGNNRGQLNFPGVDEPFNFHLSIFKSGKTYNWNGHYLGQLRNLINERYRIMSEEAASRY